MRFLSVAGAEDDCMPLFFLGGGHSVEHPEADMEQSVGLEHSAFVHSITPLHSLTPLKPQIK